MDDILMKFMNSNEVLNHFRQVNSEQYSSLVLVDLNDVLKGHSSIKWRGFNVTVLHNGLLFDSLKTLDAHYLLKGRCNYYVLMSRKKEKETTVIALRHACTNEVSSVKIIERNRMLYLGKIENGVW